MNIGILGGGKAGAAILKSFSGLSDYKIKVVCDLDQNSPGIILAKKMNIPTTDKIKDLGSDMTLDLIMELTGSKRALESLKDASKGAHDILPAYMARMLYDLMDSHDEQTKAQIQLFTRHVINISKKVEEALDSISQSEESTRDLLEGSNLNKIKETLSDENKAFADVVDRLVELGGNIKGSLELIKNASKSIQDSINNLNKMKSSME